MKNLLSFNTLLVALFAFTATLLTSCEDWFGDDEPTMPMLSASSKYVSLNPDEKSKTLYVNTNVDWTYEVDALWLNVTCNDHQLTITADDNRTEKSRSCKLTLKAAKHNLTYEVTISQSTCLITIDADVSELDFSCYDGAINTLYIKSNGDWRVTSCPEWIRCSDKTGKNNKNVTLRTLSDNKSSNPRNGIVVFSTDDQDLNIAVTQYGSAASGCNVRPNHITTLSNGIAFDMNYSDAQNVAHYYRGYIEASRSGIMTNDEIIYTLKHEFQRHLPADDEVVDFAGLKPNTKYYIYTLAYNMDGKQGELIKTEVKTNPVLDNEPCAWITNLSYDTYNWYWTLTLSATCRSYFVMATEDRSIGEASDVLQAWWLEDAARRNLIIEYSNGGPWQMPRDANVVAIWTRGRTSNGTYAGKISWEGGSISSSSQMRARRTTETKPTQIGDHSGRKLKPSEFTLYKIK